MTQTWLGWALFALRDMWIFDRSFNASPNPPQPPLSHPRVSAMVNYSTPPGTPVTYVNYCVATASRFLNFFFLSFFLWIWESAPFFPTFLCDIQSTLPFMYIINLFQNILFHSYQWKIQLKNTIFCFIL